MTQDKRPNSESVDVDRAQSAGAKAVEIDMNPEASLGEARNAAAGEAPNAVGSPAPNDAELHVPGTSEPHATDLPTANDPKSAS